MEKKIRCIPQIFHEDNFIVNFKEKNEVINTSFAKRFSKLNNRIHVYITLAVLYANQQKNQMFMILKNWTRELKMLKMCDLYRYTSKSYLQVRSGWREFSIWIGGKANVVPMHKKMTQWIKNYQFVSLFLVSKFSIKVFFSKCDQTCSFPRIWSHLLKKCLMENFIFCAVYVGKFLNALFMTPCFLIC